MKAKKTKPTSLALFVAVLLIAGSISVISCNKVREAAAGQTPGSSGGGSGVYGKVPSTRGRLTITGLGSHNGKYICGFGIENSSESLIAFGDFSSNGTVTNGSISGGKAVLKVWKAVSKGDTADVVNFTGSGSVMFMVVVTPLKNANEFKVDTGAMMQSLMAGDTTAGMVTATFVNGVGTGTFTSMY